MMLKPGEGGEMEGGERLARVPGWGLSGLAVHHRAVSDPPFLSPERERE